MSKRTHSEMWEDAESNDSSENSEDGDSTDECNCQNPEYDVENHFDDFAVSSYLSSIDDIAGLKEYYNNGRFTGANVPIEVECTKCSKPRQVTVRVNATIGWDQWRIDNDRNPSIKCFEDIEYEGVTDDNPDRSLQNCFSYPDEEWDEYDSPSPRRYQETLLVLHSPVDKHHVDSFCSYLDREKKVTDDYFRTEKSFLCLPMTERDPLCTPVSLCENAKILDNTLIILTQSASLDFLSTVKCLLNQTEVMEGKLKLLLIGRQGGKQALERLMEIEINIPVKEFENEVGNTLSSYQRQLLDWLHDDSDDRVDDDDDDDGVRVDDDDGVRVDDVDDDDS
ncbi:uncharacterized protein LOC128203074 [Mya arenaria]|uniref:uncharacterized protein LOC128203074 n=1 Tax=Mya arenaria TaxID=6604 RepID=UPI0022E383FE|nr:uncharacterized protein LOC128203074 [Mya arenaria]